MAFIMKLGSPRAWLKTMEMLLDVWSVENHLERISITLEQSRYLPPGQLWERGDAVRMLSMVCVDLDHSLSDTLLR